MNIPLNIVICDDDKKSAAIINKKVVEVLTKSNYKYNIVEVYSSDELLEYCETTNTDILLVDVDMPGMNEFEEIITLQETHPKLEVIFITERRALAYHSYECHPFGFVLKNDETRLDRVMTQLLEKITKKNSTNNILQIQIENKDVEIDVTKILYFTTSKNYIIPHSISNDNGENAFRGTMKELYEKIQSEHFVLVKKGHIINCRYIKKMDSKSVKLTNDKIISMTRDSEQQTEIKKIYGKFVREQL